MGWGEVRGVKGGEEGMDLRQNCCTFCANGHLLTVKRNNGIRKGAGAKASSYMTKYWRISLRVASRGLLVYSRSGLGVKKNR